MTWLAAVLAAAAAFLAGEAIYGGFQPPPPPNAPGGPGPTPADAAKYRVALRRADRLGAGLAQGFLGLALGLGLGLAGAKSARNGVACGLAGLVAGGAIGFAAGYLLAPWYSDVTQGKDSDLLPPLVTHGAAWAGIGLVAGLAWTAGSGLTGRRLALGALGGILGGVLGTLVYEIPAMIAFPLGRSMEPVPGSWPARLFACGVIALSIAAGVVASAGTSRTATR